MSDLFIEISITLFAAILGYILSRRIKQTASIGLILIGIIIGPSVLSLVDYQSIAVLAQLGAIILLFLIGLESNFREIYTKNAFKIALVGVLVPVLAGYVVAAAFGLNTISSLFVATALASTSIGITAAVLKELGKLATGTAKLIIGAAVIDDILGLLVLSVVVSVPTGVQLVPIFLTIVKALVFVIVSIFIGERLLSGLVDIIDYHVTGTHSSKTIFMLAVALAFGYSFVAEAIGLSAIVGAFMAGVSLAKNRNVKLFYSGAEYLEAIFTSIFFVSLGTIVSLASIPTIWLLVIILTVVAILSKVIACGFTAKKLGFSWVEAKIVGVGMVPRGEVALIIGLYGVTLGVITNGVYSAIVFMAFLTTLITPFLLSMLFAERESVAKPYTRNRKAGASKQ